MPAAPDTTPPTAPTALNGDRGERDPDQPRLDRLDRQRRRHRLPRRALRRARAARTSPRWRTPTGTPFSDTGSAPSTSLPLPRARRRCGRQPGLVLDDRHRDHAGGTRHDAADGADRADGDARSSTTQINLGWTASTDNVGVTGYRVERCQGAGCTNFAQVGDADRHRVQRHRPARRDHLPLPRARHRCGRQPRARYSTIATATTPAAPDTTPPTAPTGLTATRRQHAPRSTSPGPPRPTTSASPSYRVERCQGAGCTNFAQIGTPTGHGLQRHRPDRRRPAYRYRVRAADAAGNLSALLERSPARPRRAPTRRRRRRPTGLTATRSHPDHLSWTPRPKRPSTRRRRFRRPRSRR